jgi:3-dehydro-L-gulonate 2-dehydrogenase
MDMAMSQYSFGTIEHAAIKGETLPVFGGYNKDGNLTTDPAEIMQSKRPIPIGYWKGAGLSLVLDILATILSAGLSTRQVTQQKSEHGLSQVFVAIDMQKLSNYSAISSVINDIILDYQQSMPLDSYNQIRYPGERVLEARKRNMAYGIPVLKTVWQEILVL